MAASRRKNDPVVDLWNTRLAEFIGKPIFFRVNDMPECHRTGLVGVRRLIQADIGNKPSKRGAGSLSCLGIEFASGTKLVIVEEDFSEPSYTIDQVGDTFVPVVYLNSKLFSIRIREAAE